jgi:hypothetical protein
MNHLKIRIVTFCNINNSGKDFFHRHHYVTNHNVSEADFFFHPQASGITDGWKRVASETLWLRLSTGDKGEVLLNPYPANVENSVS